jgi:hypothetical protein
MSDELRAGAASVPFEPPFGLTLFGAVSQTQTGSGYGLPLETSAVVLDSEGMRVALCGVDICRINSPEVGGLIERVAAELEMDPAGVLLNRSHTHQGILGAYGGYEAGYGNRGFGLPAQVTADSERILVETGVRLAEALFPGCAPCPAQRGFVATGEVPELDVRRLLHPSTQVAARA